MKAVFFKNVLHKPFNQDKFVALANDRGVYLNPKGACYALAVQYALNDMEVEAEKGKGLIVEGVIERLEEKVLASNNEFLELTLYIQTQVQLKSRVARHFYQIGSALDNNTNFLEVLPTNLRSAKYLNINLISDSFRHIVLLTIIQRNDKIYYKIFDPNHGETIELTAEDFEMALRDLILGVYKMHSLKCVQVEDTETVIRNFINHEEATYTDYLYLHYALRSKRMILSLIEKGADLNKTYCGDTALYFALKYNVFDCIDILLEKGADPNIKNNEGKTPLHLAVEKGLMSICRILIKNNANLDVRDNKGFTPLDYAIITSNPDLIKLLAETSVRNKLRLVTLNLTDFIISQHIKSLYVKFLLIDFKEGEDNNKLDSSTIIDNVVAKLLTLSESDDKGLNKRCIIKKDINPHEFKRPRRDDESFVESYPREKNSSEYRLLN
jgi:hypothetical protein